MKFEFFLGNGVKHPADICQLSGIQLPEECYRTSDTKAVPQHHLSKCKSAKIELESEGL